MMIISFFNVLKYANFSYCAVKVKISGIFALEKEKVSKHKLAFLAFLGLKKVKNESCFDFEGGVKCVATSKLSL